MIENSVIHKSLSNVTGMSKKVSLSLLKFIHKYNGYISGSCAMAMYLKSNNKPYFNVPDIDIYIPSSDELSYFDENWWPHSDNLVRAVESNADNDIKVYGNVSKWHYIVKDFISYFTEYSGLYERVSAIKRRYHDDGVGDERTSDAELPLPWNVIVDFERKRLNNDHVVAGQPKIQLIFIDKDAKVGDYINANFDFAACKIYTTFDIKNPFAFALIDPYFLNKKVLDVPQNWKSITTVACFKTVTSRYIKYLKRGFIPNFVKTHKIDLPTALKRMGKELTLYVYKKLHNVKQRGVHRSTDISTRMFSEYQINEELDRCKQTIESDDFFNNIQISHPTILFERELKKNCRDILLEYIETIRLLGFKTFNTFADDSRGNLSKQEEKAFLKEIDNELLLMGYIKNNQQRVLNKMLTKKVPEELSRKIIKFGGRKGKRTSLKSSR